MHAEAAFGPGRDLERAPEERDTLAHADEPVAGLRGRCRPAPGAVVHHVDRHRVGVSPDANVRAGRSGVLERIRQRFLNDPVDRELKCRRQVVVRALDRELDGEAGGTHGRGERFQLGDAGLQRKRGTAVALALHAQEAAHLDEGLAAAALDLLERRRRRMLVLRACAAGLQNDDAEVVRDDVVQLARKSRALIGNRDRRRPLVLVCNRLERRSLAPLWTKTPPSQAASNPTAKKAPARALPCGRSGCCDPRARRRRSRP
jgi:hypothetical protein